MFTGIPSNEIVSRHIHKLVQVMYISHFFFYGLVYEAHVLHNSLFQVLGETIHIASEYLGHEAKAVSAGSKVEASEAENPKLRRGLISAMDEANTTKEKAKALVDDLKVEKQLTVEKDEQLQAAN